MKRNQIILIAVLSAGLWLTLPDTWAADNSKAPPQAKEAEGKTLPPSKFVNDEGEVVRRVWTTTKLRRWMESATQRYEALPEDVKPENYYRMERSYGTFQRSFSLPSTVDQERIRARFRDGVLEIVLPKLERAKPKAIPVETD